MCYANEYKSKTLVTYSEVLIDLKPKTCHAKFNMQKRNCLNTLGQKKITLGVLSVNLKGNFGWS